MFRNAILNVALVTISRLSLQENDIDVNVRGHSVRCQLFKLCPCSPSQEAFQVELPDEQLMCWVAAITARSIA